MQDQEERPTYCLKNVYIFDGMDFRNDQLSNIFIDNGIVSEVSDRPPNASDGRVINGDGRTALPGLIDAHIHAYAAQLNLSENDKIPKTYVALHAKGALEAMLNRGFTTVRDCGGADYGLARSLADGLIVGPRLFYCGKLISQTGGHGDFRHPGEGNPDDDFCWSCGCGKVGHLSVCADGVDEVVRAVRENFRRGASFIKFSASGGVSSQSGSLTALQYSDNEIRAIVSESERHTGYCTAHIHPDAGIKRAISLGVHCVEHGTFIEQDTAGLAAEKGTFIVPTLSVVAGLSEVGHEHGLSKVSQEKLKVVFDSMISRLNYMKSEGVKVGFGTDLLGPLSNRQYEEFRLRADVFSQLEILQQATSTNAELLGQSEKLGCIKPGAIADILIMDGDPVHDAKAFNKAASNLRLIMKNGRLHKSELD